MARQYLIEGLKGSVPFIVDTTKIVTESLPNGAARTRIPGRFSVCDCVNGNGRRYGRNVWEKNFQQGSNLMKSIQEKSAWGLLEHPKDGKVDLNSPICIRTTEAKLQEGKDEKGNKIWEVTGEISILNPKLVPEAARLTAMIEEGYNPRVSSRGFGSLVRNESDGVDDVQDDYICEGWDVVMKPSFESAMLNAQPESAPAGTTSESKSAPAAPAPTKLSETAPPTAANNNAAVFTAVVTSTPGVSVTLETERGSQAPSAAAPAAAKKTTESSQKKSMNVNEINSQIASFRSTDPTKLNPKRFAEGMSQLSALHNEVAKYLAEDATRSWQVGQLHEEIKEIENSWTATQLAPGKKATKLTEDNTKLMQVIKATATTALTFKKKLGESAKAANRQSALLNEVTERGQAWKQHAKAMEAECEKFKRRFMMASEALNQFAKKYKTDVTQLGKAHLALEFKEKISTPEFQAMLKEAVKPKALVPIRMAVEGKITVEVAKSILEGKVSLDEILKSLKPAVEEGKKPAGAPLAEGKRPDAAPAAKPGSPAATVSEGVTIISSKPGDPRQLDEAIGMVGRLSSSTNPA